ncbi:MAG TPA: Fe-Mn family superoxide dismutase [Steroidobacteraceae bacterium]|jgi:Fe-Mn family superoxide dismutase|nr:Fe-Mn family superoxide dismutase [Steroidobacteraceae bacterium]
MIDTAKRETLTLLGTAAAGAMMTSAAGAQNASSARPDVRSPMSGGREPKPLTFDPAKLNGLSEKLIRSHWENNYIGSVKTLNMVAGRLLAAMNDPDLPPVIYGGLKREELHRLGSVVLHEQYFGNLGGDGKAGGDILAALKKSYGSYEAWEAEFRRTAMSLAGGSGWCVLTYNVYTHELRNQWAWDHMHGAIAAVPLLVLDMYEHSYHMDYGSAAAKYVDAFMHNVNWEEVDKRFGARPA